jgi:hypothetical protein
MKDEMIFEYGSKARCNRCNTLSEIGKDIRGTRENSKCYRLQGFTILACGHMDCHWVFVSDNPDIDFSE